MSKKSNQSIGLLVIFCDVIKTMQDGRCFAKVDLQKTLVDLYEDAGHAVEFWPILISLKWVEDRRKAFAKFLQDLDKDGYPDAELVRMMDRIVVDLIDFNQTGVRRQYVGKLLPGVQQLVAHVDPEGCHYQALDNSGEILDRLYEIFEIDDRAYA